MNTSIINKKKRKHDKTVLLAKDKFNSAKILIFKALIESYITHDELASVNNMLREYDDMKDTVKTSIQLRPQRFIENLKLKCRRKTKSKIRRVKRQKKKTDSFIKTSIALY